MTDKKTILIVEDDDDGRTVISKIVESLGYNQLSFGSGREAIEAIKTKNVDLALIDIMMPEMNGYEVLKAIREMPQYASLPCIMVTAKDEDSEVIEGYKYGADYYIPKPYTSKQIEYGIKLYISA